MANLITLSRLLLLLVVILIIYRGAPAAQLGGVLLLIIVFVSDGVDGYVARKRGETSLFGAIFDIAADRTVELCLWVVFAHIGSLPVWIPLVFITRGVMTDAIRASESQSHQQSPFEIMHTRLGKALVAGRFMRGSYAVLKAVTFCILMLALPLPEIAPAMWQQWGNAVQALGLALACASVLICVLRGLPVILEFAQRKGFSQ
jgi:CDP-diacylglycerol--glycerol-3-phosphate 3-phosphatidyltransferase